MGTSSKTTKAGVIGAALTAIIGVLAVFGYITAEQAQAIGTALVTLTTLIVAILAKDWNVTGGNVVDPKATMGMGVPTQPPSQPPKAG